MQKEILSIRTLFVVVLTGLAFSAAFFSYSIHRNRVEINSISPTANTATLNIVLLPMRLKIPSINVDATIEQVGLTPDGAMDVPKGPAEVAWYKLGSRPGEKGSAVMAGHSGWKNNIPAVFDNLNKLKKGDKIYIEDEKGIIVTFVVRELRNYDPKANATDVFTSSDEKAHLNLVTCEGIWNEITKSRSGRLVVFTDILP